MGLSQKRLEVAQRSVRGVDTGVVRNIVAVVFERRGVERQQPEGAHAQVLEIIQLLHEPAKVPDAIVVAIVEGADVNLIDDRVLVP